MSPSIGDIAQKIHFVVCSHASGTAADSGDNTLVAAPGAGLRLVIRQFVVENEDGDEPTAILKQGATAVKRRLTTAKGDGLGVHYPIGGEWRLPENSALVLNLSAANTFGYSVEYLTERIRE